MADRRDLYEELKEKNHTARSAQTRPSGKIKYLLPCDKLSASELKKLNGEIVMYEMKKPISWSRFKGYPLDMQKEYLQWFSDEFSASPGMMAKIFGMSPTYICTLFRQMGLTSVMHRQPTRDGLDRFNKWLEQFKDDKVQEVKMPEPPVEKKEKLVIPPFFNTITSGKIILEGKASEIGQTLFNMFQNETITMQVEFEVVKQKEVLVNEEVV